MQIDWSILVGKKCVSQGKIKAYKMAKDISPKKRHGKPINIEKGEKAECRGWMRWHYNVTTKCFGLVVSNMNFIFHFIYGIKHLSTSIYMTIWLVVSNMNFIFHFIKKGCHPNPIGFHSIIFQGHIAPPSRIWWRPCHFQKRSILVSFSHSLTV